MMKERINKAIDNVKKAFMLFPVSFVSIILYTLFITIFIDKDIFSDDILLSVTVCIFMTVAQTINLESTEYKTKKEKIIYLVCAFEVGIIFAVLANVFKMFEPVTFVGVYYFYFLITLFVALVLFFIYKSFKKQTDTFIEYFKHVFLKAIELGFKYGVLAVGFLIITIIFDTLITDQFDDQLLKIQMLIVGWYLVPNGIVLFTKSEKKDSEFLLLLFNNILSILLEITFVIIYCYILKIVFTFEMPKNEVFAIMTFVFTVGLPIWTINMTCKNDKVWTKANNYLPYAFIPLIILQIIALAMRIAGNGFTEMRYLGMVLIVFEIIYEVFYIRKYKLEHLLFVVIGLVAITLICPFINMTNVSLNDQYNRLNKEYTHKGNDNYKKIANLFDYFKDTDPKLDYISKKYTKEEFNDLNDIYKEYHRYYGYDANYKTYYFYGDTDLNIDIYGYNKVVSFNVYNNYKHVKIDNKEYDFSEMVNQIMDGELDFRKGNKYYLNDLMLVMQDVSIDYIDDTNEVSYLSIKGLAFIK